jgi:hypothetical protein
MAIDVQEIVPSGSGGVGTVDGAVEARYRITSAVSDTLADIEAALLAYSPSTYRGLYRASPPHIEQLGGEVWIGTVRYAANAFAAVQVPTFQFTTAGGRSTSSGVSSARAPPRSTAPATARRTTGAHRGQRQSGAEAGGGDRHRLPRL